MPRTAVIGKDLRAVMEEENLQQKYIAYDTNTPLTTLNGHVKGGRVNADKAVQYAESVNNSNFSLGLANKFFGTLKSLDGDLLNTDSPNDLEIIQEFEAEERKEHKLEAQRILAKRKNKITLDDKQVLIAYANEFLDEIALETTIVVSIFKICGLSIMAAVKKRMPYWIKKGYMRKE